MRVRKAGFGIRWLVGLLPPLPSSLPARMNDGPSWFVCQGGQNLFRLFSLCSRRLLAPCSRQIVRLLPPCSQRIFAACPSRGIDPFPYLAVRLAEKHRGQNLLRRRLDTLAQLVCGERSVLARKAPPRSLHPASVIQSCQE